MISRDDNKFSVLEIISKSEMPVGANQIKRELMNMDIEISEATVGRILSGLDQEGLTKKQGFKGRVLTEEGHNFLEKMRAQRERMEYGEELFKVLASKSEKELVEVLVARKVIESYLAKLAAINITSEIAKAMEQAINLQTSHSKRGIAAEYDVMFHKLIAKAAGNEVLEAMLELIRKDSQLTPALEYIRKKVKSSVIVDHKKIFEAIINKDPEGAEKAMTEHIDNLIKDVHKYWEKTST